MTLFRQCLFAAAARAAHPSSSTGRGASQLGARFAISSILDVMWSRRSSRRSASRPRRRSISVQHAPIEGLPMNYTFDAAHVPHPTKHGKGHMTGLQGKNAIIYGGGD